MKTYRVYALDVSKPLAPVAHVCYVSSVKYDGAWKAARGALDADKRGKPVNGYPTERATLFSDEALKVTFANFGDAFTVARIDDMTARNVKIDGKALKDALNDVDTNDDKAVLAALNAARTILGIGAK